MHLLTTVICVASGPSLNDAQRAIAKEAHRRGRCSIAVVNNNFMDFPDADLLYAGDGPWWRQYSEAVRATFHGECWTRKPRLEGHPINKIEREHAEIVAARPWLNRVPVSAGEGLASDGTVNLLGNSLAQLSGLLVVLGNRRQLWIGCDMSYGPKGEKHHHADHPKPLTNGVPTSWIRRFDQYAIDAKERGVEIINCTIRTALTQFPRAALEEAL